MIRLRLAVYAAISVVCVASAALGATAVAAPSAYEPIYPMVSPDGKHIGWVEGQTWRIWIADPDGANAHVFGPSFAANGIGQVAWTRLGMIVDSNYTLFTVASTGKRVRIALAADQTFSYGGDHVAVDGGQSGGPGELVDLRTKKVTKLGEVVPVLSPDGTRLAWTTPTGIWVSAVSGANAREIALSGPAGCLAWSPDNKSVAYVASTGKGSPRVDLHVTPVTGGVGRVVAKQLTGCNLSWSPDRKSIALYSARLTVVDVASGSVRRSPMRIGRVAGGFAWSRDSAAIYLTARPFAAEAAANNCTSLWRLKTHSLAGRVVVRGCQ